MREILFRGKRVDNGEWVEGYLFISDTDNSTFIVCGSWTVKIEFEVDPTTVGQYTGLQDKNGTKIFDGNIVKYTSTVCPEDTTTGRIEMYHGSWTLLDGIGLISIGQCNPKSLRVVGNVYDNPNC